MKLMPASAEDWLKAARFYVKWGIVLVWPVILMLESWAGQGGSAYQVWRQMHGMENDVCIGYFAAGVFLAVTGAMALWQRRRKQAIWDFIFAVYALLWSAPDQMAPR